MASATVTSKGQITIPVAVRRALGLEPGSRLVFEVTEEGRYEIRPETRSIRERRGSVPRPARPVSLEELDEAIAAGAVDRS